MKSFYQSRSRLLYSKQYTRCSNGKDIDTEVKIFQNALDFFEYKNSGIVWFLEPKLLP